MDYRNAMRIVNEIWEQIKTIGGMNMIGSWGVSKLEAGIHDGKPCLILNVSGFKHKGLVVVAYNPMDYYEVYLKKNKSSEPVLVNGEVYFDELADVIDNAIENTGENYKEDFMRSLMAI